MNAPATLPLWYRCLSPAAFLAAGVTIALGFYLLVSSAAMITDWGHVLAGAAIYVMSQVLRSIRLAIIVGDPGKSLRQLVQAHLVGAAGSFCLPYKLGDLLRLGELAFVLQRGNSLGLWRGILVMWIERVYDALPIAILLLFLGLTIGEDTFRTVAPILAALTAFIMATLVTFFVLPENLDGLALFLARRYHGPRVVHLLHHIDRLYRLTADAKRMLHRKHITLITVSTLLWGAEIAVIDLIFGEGSFSGSATALLRFLSGLLAPTFSYEPGSLSVYSATIGLPLLLLGLLAWIGTWRSGRLRMLATLRGTRLVLQRSR